MFNMVNQAKSLAQNFAIFLAIVIPVEVLVAVKHLKKIAINLNGNFNVFQFS